MGVLSLLKLDTEKFYEMDGQAGKVFKARPGSLVEALSDGTMVKTSIQLDPNEKIFTEKVYIPKKKLFLKAYAVIVLENGKFDSMDERADLNRLEDLP
jgi:hypothetical protein